MRRGQPLPRMWMMTDERQGDRLWPALENLPRGSGVVVRHYSLADIERRALAARIRRIAQRRRLVLVVAGSPAFALRCRADGFHERSGRVGPPGLLRTMPVHDAREMVLANRVGADAVFVSPVFPTDSHPGAPALGRRGLARLAQGARAPVIALGDMTAGRARSLPRHAGYGWAAIGALTPES